MQNVLTPFLIHIIHIMQNMARNRRRSGQCCVTSAVLTKDPQNRKKFLFNSKNKRQLLKLLLNELRKETKSLKKYKTATNLAYEGSSQ